MRTLPAALGAGILALTLLFTGCSTAEAPEAPVGAEQQNLLSRHGLAGLDAREVIQKLDTTALVDRPEGLQASIRPDELILVDSAGEDRRMPLPEDQVYIAFAPYVNETHECTFHAPNSCVGEMRDETLRVTITDSATGERYADGAATTYDNGFIGYWLPRDVDVTITVTDAGRTGSVEATTRGTDAPTCITTLQLA